MSRVRAAFSPRSVVRVVPLVVLWVGLWGTVSLANVVSGLLAALFVLVVFPLPAGDDRRVAPLALLRFAGVFLVLVVKSTWSVVVAVVRPRGHVRPGLVDVELADDSPVITTVVANAITLTPGTLTVDVHTVGGRSVLRVHALDASDPAGVRADGADIERLARAAFPPPRAVAAAGEAAT